MKNEYIKENYAGFTIYRFPVCDSTNIRIKEMAENARDNTIVIADMQTAGRGRKDRSWLSRSGAGAWFSCLIKPETDMPAYTASGLVFVAALSVAKTIRKLSGADALIKWPNDIVINGKKISGIMCEMRAKDMNLDFALVGIGVNLLGFDFPKDLPYASSVQKETNAEIASDVFLKAFLSEYETDRKTWQEKGLKEILDAIKPLSATIGKTVMAISDTETITGTARDINDDGSLVIDTENGERTFIAGDVSVRGIMGYA